MKVLSNDGLTKLIQLSKDNFLDKANVSTVTLATVAESGDYNDLINKPEVSGYHPNILSWEWDDHLRNDVQWLRGDTFSWQDGTVYEAAMQHLVDEFNPIEADWTVATENIQLYNNLWKDLVWDGTKFVALGSGGAISISTNGTKWTSATDNANLGSNTWTGLAWDGTKFVALGNGGYISTSTDGTNWTTATQNANLGSHRWFDLAWDGTKFVALGYEGYISTSTDGTTWTAATRNANLGSHGWTTLAWDGTKFVALGNPPSIFNQDSYVSTSTDGTTWTTATQNANLGINTWNRLAWDGTKFMALTSDGRISTSTDGTTWTTATQNANLGSHNWNGLGWDGTKFVALGLSGYISTLTNTKKRDIIDGIMIEYELASDGHKICLEDQEENILHLYNKTGVAWYYILGKDVAAFNAYSGLLYYRSTENDVPGAAHPYAWADTDVQPMIIYTDTKYPRIGDNVYETSSSASADPIGSPITRIYEDSTYSRFKLPRAKHGKFGDIGVMGNGTTIGITDGKSLMGLQPANNANYGALNVVTALYNQPVGTDSNISSSTVVIRAGLGITGDPEKSGIVAHQEQEVDQYKYLYFYVGEYTQSALENTAGINSELFNSKADVSTVAHVVIAYQAPSVANDYTWYRKYNDGWIEQGGILATTTPDYTYSVVLPNSMANVNYSIQLVSTTGNNNANIISVYTGTAISKTGFSFRLSNKQSNASTPTQTYWEVKGIAA